MKCKAVCPLASHVVVSLLAALGVVIACGGEDAPSSPLGPAASEAPRARPAPLRPSRPAPDPSEPSQAGVFPAKELRRDADIPDYYPDDAPRYPGATASQAALSPDGKANMLFGSDDSVDEVASYLAEFLPEHGWNMGAADPAPVGVLIEGDKAGREIKVMVRRFSEGSPDAVTMIAVLVDP